MAKPNGNPYSVFVRAPYNYDTDEVSRETGLYTDPSEEVLTIQSAKDECDINVIVERFGLTGQLPTSVRLPEYGDFDCVDDFQSAMAALQQAQDSFMELPAKIRAKFENDPQKFHDFVLDPANIGELRELGLAKPEAKADNPANPADSPPA